MIRNKNLRSNKRFGGDEKIKEEGTFRSLLQNSNSIKMLSAHEAFAHKFEFVEKVQIDVWAVPETKLPWNQKIQNLLQKLGRKQFKTFKIKGTSSNEGCIGDYQPEGSDSRGLGQWSYFVMNGKQGKELWIIAGYHNLQD
eukprot:4935097-Ditylum_brightwellii.AAC.1